MRSIVCSKSAPSNNSEIAPLPLSMCLCKLKETGSLLLGQFELQQQKTSGREHDDSHNAIETSQESSGQEVHVDTKLLINKQNCYLNKKSIAKNCGNK